MDLFFYGTLMDRDVLKAVIGRALPPAYTARAVLSGYRRVYKSGANYPILEPAPEQRIEGVVVSALKASDVARLDAFEGLNYRRAIRPVIVSSSQERRDAWVYLSNPNVRGTNREWNLRKWTRQYKRTYINHINRVGSYPKSLS